MGWISSPSSTGDDMAGAMIPIAGAMSSFEGGGTCRPLEGGGPFVGGETMGGPPIASGGETTYVPFIEVEKSPFIGGEVIPPIGDEATPLIGGE